MFTRKRKGFTSNHSFRKHRRRRNNDKIVRAGSGERSSIDSVCFYSFPKGINDIDLFSRHHIIPYGKMAKLYDILNANGDEPNKKLWHDTCKVYLLSKMGCRNATDKPALQFCYLYVNLFAGPVALNRSDDPGNDYERKLPASMPDKLRSYITVMTNQIKDVIKCELHHHNVSRKKKSVDDVKKNSSDDDKKKAADDVQQANRDMQQAIKNLLETSFSKKEIDDLLEFLMIGRMSDVYPFILSDWEIDSSNGKWKLKDRENPELHMVKNYSNFAFFRTYVDLSLKQCEETTSSTQSNLINTITSHAPTIRILPQAISHSTDTTNSNSVQPPIPPTSSEDKAPSSSKGVSKSTNQNPTSAWNR